VKCSSGNWMILSKILSSRRRAVDICQSVGGLLIREF
jgi:hypothetical protein